MYVHPNLNLSADPNPSLILALIPYHKVDGRRLDWVLRLLDGGDAGEELVAARQLVAVHLQRRDARRQLFDGPLVVLPLLPLLLAVLKLRSPVAADQGTGQGPGQLVLCVFVESYGPDRRVTAGEVRAACCASKSGERRNQVRVRVSDSRFQHGRLLCKSVGESMTVAVQARTVRRCSSCTSCAAPALLLRLRRRFQAPPRARCPSSGARERGRRTGVGWRSRLVRCI